MTTLSSREELERQAEQLRSHLLTTVEELERKSHVRITEPSTAAAGAQAKETEESEGSEGTNEERERLEHRANTVREHLIDRVETLEKKARERIVPIVVVGGAIMLLMTISWGYMFYKVMRS